MMMMLLLPLYSFVVSLCYLIIVHSDDNIYNSADNLNVFFNTNYDNGNNNLKCSDPLACYLNSIIIDIPDIDITLLNIDLTLKELSCDHLYLDSIPSLYKAPTTINFGINEFGISCSGKYKYGFIKGTTKIIIDHTSLDIDLLIQKEAITNLPVLTNFTSCAVSSMNVTVIFSGGLLNQLDSILEQLIKDEVEQLLCVRLSSYCDIVRTIDIL